MGRCGWLIKYRNLRRMNQEMSEIIDGVFFEKLSLMLGNLQGWQKQKEEVFEEMYGTAIESKLVRVERTQKELKAELLQFLKAINQQSLFLSKLRKDEKEVEVSSAFPSFQQLSAKFSGIKQALIELGDFLGKLMGVTNYEYCEARKIHEEAVEIRSRYSHQKNKLLHTYNSKKELSYSKKNMRKHFELGRYLDLLALLQKQRKLHQEIYLRAHNTLVRDLDIRVKIYHDLTENLQFAAQLYQKGFRQNELEGVIAYFRERHERATEDRILFKQHQEGMAVNEEPYQHLKRDFLKQFDSFLQEITVANWSASFQNREEQPQRPENKLNGSLIVTFDHKLLLFRGQSRDILLEQTAEDLKVYPPDGQGTFNLKDKRAKVKFQVEFQKPEQQDELFLHLSKMGAK